MLKVYLHNLITATFTNNLTPTFHNITIRFTSPPSTTTNLALKKLIGIITYTGDAIKGALAAATSKRTLKNKGKKH